MEPQQQEGDITSHTVPPSTEQGSCPGISPGRTVSSLRYEVTPQASEFTLGQTFAATQTMPMPQVSLTWAHGNLLSSTEVSHEFVHAQDLLPPEDKPAGRDIMFVESHMQKDWLTIPVTSVISQGIDISTHKIKVTGTVTVKGKGKGTGKEQTPTPSDAPQQYWH